MISDQEQVPVILDLTPALAPALAPEFIFQLYKIIQKLAVSFVT
jgi:hypothetical protein